MPTMNQSDPAVKEPLAAPRSRLVARSLRVLGRICLLALGVAGVGAVAGAIRIHKAWPKVDGAEHVRTMLHSASVVRDEIGIPQIYADNEHDLFAAQGYVHAQDR